MMTIWFRDEDCDPLDSARGFCTGIITSMGFWFAVGMVVYWVI